MKTPKILSIVKHKLQMPKNNIPNSEAGKVERSNTTRLNMNAVVLITIKELKFYFDHPSGYLLIGLFLLVNYFFFLRPFFLIGNASLREMFNMLPLILSAFIPAVTMGLFAQERDKQTIEYLMTKPVSVIQLFTGKILGASSFVISALFLTLPLPFFIAKIGQIDAGETFAGYLSAVILIISLSTLGAGISSLFKNQISAFLSTLAIILVLTLIGSDYFSLNIPQSITKFFAIFSVQDHYQSIARGVLEFKDIGYFLLLILVSSVVGYISLQKIRVSRTSMIIKKSILAVLITASIVFTVSFISTQIQARLDLTSARKYTLSNVTREILAEPGKVQINVYESADLPNQYKIVSDELKNMLTDYQNLGKGKISVSYFDPKEKESDLIAQGIGPIQFNVIGQDQFQVKQGYLAVVIQNEDKSKTEKIDFVNDIDSLEYDLTTLVYKVKSEEGKEIAFASGNGEKSVYENLTILKQYLDNEYDVGTVVVPAEDETGGTGSPDNFNLEGKNLLIIASPIGKYSESAVLTIKEYLNSGGKILYFSDALNISQEMMTASAPKVKRGDLFSDLGITVNTSLLYDPNTPIPIVVNSANGPVRVNYPFIMPAYLNAENEGMLSNAAKSIMLAWANGLDISDDSWKVLYLTSNNTSAQTSSYNLDFLQEFVSNNPKQHPIIAIRDGENGSKIAVVSSSSLFDDDLLQNSQENLQLAMSLIESLAQGRNFSEIKAKNLLGSRFDAITVTQKNSINYVAPALSFLGLFIIAGSRIMRRRMLEIKVEGE